MSDSLYDRIGGADAVKAAVEIFYGKVFSDPILIPFFANTDKDKQRIKQRNFLIYAFGGPNNYDGRDMRAAHTQAVSEGLNDDHFNAVAGHLQATLEELKVPTDLIGEAMAIAASTHDDVLNL